MRIHLAALACISIVFELHIGQAAEIGSRPQPPTSQTQPSIALQSQERSAKDCEGKAPVTGSVTALLSKLVHSSNSVRGVQCPIPHVPDQSITKELHQ